MEAKKWQFFGKEGTFPVFQLETSAYKTVKFQTQIIYHIFKCLACYNNNIKIYQTYLPLQAWQNRLHRPLKSSWCITQSKRHHCKFKQSLWASTRSVSTCQWPGLRSKQENHCEPASWFKDSSIHGKGYASFMVMSIHTGPVSAIFFFDHDDTTGPWTLWGLYNFFF